MIPRVTVPLNEPRLSTVQSTRNSESFGGLKPANTNDKITCRPGECARDRSPRAKTNESSWLGSPAAELMLIGAGLCVALLGLLQQQAFIESALVFIGCGFALALAGALSAWRSHSGARAATASAERRLERLAEKFDNGLEALEDMRWGVRDSEARYRDLAQGRSDVVFRCDKEGRLSFVNDAFCETFGVEVDAILGQHFEVSVTAGDSAEDATRDPQTNRRRYIQEVETAAGFA